MQKRRKVPWPIIKTKLTKECRERFGRHGLRPARRSFGRAKDLKSLERVKGIQPLVFSLKDCCPNDWQQNPSEAFEDAARIVGKIYPRAGLFVSATEMLLKIQLIKFNLMVPADCAPTSASRHRRSLQS
jgi:hypothetical protein